MQLFTVALSDLWPTTIYDNVIVAQASCSLEISINTCATNRGADENG